ncbi:MAG TPA: hypothetical protein VMW83_09645 [Spirochaetia bacterium]|nr:hypothetical protein [Spirochaetia bacterium]
MQECLFLLVDSPDTGVKLPEEILTGLPGIRLVHKRSNKFFYVVFDPAVIEHDSIIEALINADISIKQFNVVAAEDYLRMPSMPEPKHDIDHR